MAAAVLLVLGAGLLIGGAVAVTVPIGLMTAGVVLLLAGIDLRR